MTSLLVSCDKDTDEEANPDEQTSSAPIPSYPAPSDADAVLVAVKSSMPSPVSIPNLPGGTLTIDFGMGVALFKDRAKADKVTLNGIELSFTNGVHTWLPNLTNLSDPSSIMGINLSGDIKWSVTNPQIDKTLRGLPGTPSITSVATIQRSDGYVLRHAAVSGAQTILYAIHANNKSVMKELPGNSSQCTFSASELAELGTSKNAIIQANAYVINQETIGGKKIYFVRQSSYSQTGVEIK